MTWLGGDPVVEAVAVTKSYGTGAAPTRALDGVSFRLDRGEIVALTGPSGSGKSTLMNLIGLLDPPSGGRLSVCSLDARGIDADTASALRNTHIGFVFQSCDLLADRTVLENVALPLAYRGVGRRTRRETAEARIRDVALAHRARAYPDTLSGGERQRAAIARALVTDPDLVIADEPTAALDRENGMRVMRFLRRIADDGRAVLVVTHDPAIADLADRRLCLSAGRLTEPEPCA